MTRSRIALLLVLSGAVFMEGVDVSMMGVALPSIRAELDLSTSELQWIVSAYVLGYGGFVLLGGRAADLLGRRRMFLAWMAVFVVFSVGRDRRQRRAADRRPVRHRRRGRVHGARRAVDHHVELSGGLRAQPRAARLRGGGGRRVLARDGGRRVADGDRVAVGVLRPRRHGFTVVGAGVAGRPARRTGRGARRVRPGRRAEPHRRDDPARLHGRARAGRRRGPHGPRAGGERRAAPTAFVAIERRAAAPLVRLGILRSASLVRANVGTMLFIGAFMAFQFVAVLYLQELRGWSSVETGLALMVLGSTRSSRRRSRRGWWSASASCP